MDANQYAMLASSLKSQDPIPKQDVEEKQNELLAGTKDVLNVVTGGVAADQIQEFVNDTLRKGKKVAVEQVQKKVGQLRDQGLSVLNDASGAPKEPEVVEALKNLPLGESEDNPFSFKNFLKREGGDEELEGFFKRRVVNPFNNFRAKVNKLGIDGMRDQPESFTQITRGATDPYSDLGYDDPFKFNADKYSALSQARDDDLFNEVPKQLGGGRGQAGKVLQTVSQEAEQANKVEIPKVNVKEELAGKIEKGVAKVEEEGGAELDTDPLGAGIEAAVAVGGAIASAFIKTKKDVLAPMAPVTNYSVGLGV